MAVPKKPAIMISLIKPRILLKEVARPIMPADFTIDLFVLIFASRYITAKSQKFRKIAKILRLCGFLRLCGVNYFVDIFVLLCYKFHYYANTKSCV